MHEHAQGIPLSSLSRATITQGRQHIAACLLTQQTVSIQSMLVTTAISTTPESPPSNHTYTSHVSEWTPTALPTELISSTTTPSISLHSQPRHDDPPIYPNANPTHPTLDIPLLACRLHRLLCEGSP